MAAAAAAQAAPDAQDGLFDQVIDNDLLERALDKREAVKAAKGKALKAFKEADALAKAHLAELELDDDTTIRVGRFRIVSKSVPSRAVSFETQPTTRLSIGVIAE